MIEFISTNDYFCYYHLCETIITVTINFDIP